ncbi:MAG: SDR family oxidoreductase [Actinomycetota bacterium]|nr:MAG: SDR family oxidoreductase [Actinomycetota bacterium]
MSRVVLVTGGNRGIGLGIARAFDALGDTVVVTHRSGPPPEGLRAVQCDVTDTASVEAAFDWIEAEVGPVDVLVANAGIARDALLVRLSDEAIAEVIETNLVGTMRVARRAARSMMRRRSGRMIFISSVLGYLGAPGASNYAASKAALVGLARSLVYELAPRNITINVVLPGYVETDLTATLPAERSADIMARVPARRFAQLHEVSSVVTFLASEDAGYVNGAVIAVDGGAAMGH